MRAAARLGWRATAVVAFAATAALAVTLTRGAPMHAALIATRHPGQARAHDAAPRCAASGLRVSLDADTSTARGLGLEVTRYAVDFTNVSGVRCALGGYPEVAAYRGNGVQVGNAAAADTTAAAHRVVLAPGATARASVTAIVAGAVSASAGGCRPVVAAGLRVAPPGRGRPAPRYIRHSLLACSAAGPRAPVFLRVRAVQPDSAGKLDAGAARQTR